ncbi:MAG: ABC transporter ATP-binding protein [Eubacteriales bacterium]|nr:ABC transporter ATP-binding protein [Eubacteriales bacterium]MDD3350449.1 ABC transporter ATP-binding protein [Eubacteriales bacterium]
MGDAIVTLLDVDKFFGANHVIKKLNLTVQQGEFLTLLGPSGCGKTTILRMIAGFEDASAGSIEVQGERVEDKEAFERDVNTVFQSYALFPHMTVFDNIAYGLTVKRVPKQEIKERVKEMLALVQLEGFEGRRPDMMSGGQKQRVAIARALINNPKVLLLDEPLGALDLKLRKQMQLELKRLQKKLNITFIYVTHDQEEAMTMSDRIAVINNGILEQIDTPKEIYKHPKTRFVADFIGESNILEGQVLDCQDGLCRIQLETGMVLLQSPNRKPADPVMICVRPEVMKYERSPVDGFSLPGTIKDIIFVGAQYRTLIVLENGMEIKVNRVKPEKDLKEGDSVYLYWEPEDALGIGDLKQGGSVNEQQ